MFSREGTAVLCKTRILKFQFWRDNEYFGQGICEEWVFYIVFNLKQGKSLIILTQVIEKVGFGEIAGLE